MHDNRLNVFVFGQGIMFGEFTTLPRALCVARGRISPPLSTLKVFCDSFSQYTTSFPNIFLAKPPGGVDETTTDTQKQRTSQSSPSATVHDMINDSDVRRCATRVATIDLSKICLHSRSGNIVVAIGKDWQQQDGKLRDLYSLLMYEATQPIYPFSHCVS